MRGRHPLNDLEEMLTALVTEPSAEDCRLVLADWFGSGRMSGTSQANTSGDLHGVSTKGWFDA